MINHSISRPSYVSNITALNVTFNRKSVYSHQPNLSAFEMDQKHFEQMPLGLLWLMLFDKRVGEKLQSDNISSTYVKFKVSNTNSAGYNLPAQLLVEHLHPSAGKHQ